MRLSDWRAAAPNRDSLGPRVVPVLEPVLATLGAEPNPHLWISWGDDPRFRYTIFVVTPGGLGICVVRPGQGGEGPRIAAKLVRWGRVQLGELDVETQQGHRLLTVQLEGHVLKGVDADADGVARFARAVMAAIDGRQMPSLEEPARRRRSAPKAAASKKPAAAPRKPRTRPPPS
jgi:hypothetical protein